MGLSPIGKRKRQEKHDEIRRLAEGHVDEEVRWAFLLYTEETADKLA